MFAFPRGLRLLMPKHYCYVFQRPQRVSSLEITILGRFNKLRYPRVGFVITKKNIKLAYKRNRIKRLIREYFRLHQHELPFMDFVILVKSEVANLEKQEITKILGKLWDHYYYLSHNS